jgi:hypothetical protein
LSSLSHVFFYYLLLIVPKHFLFPSSLVHSVDSLLPVNFRCICCTVGTMEQDNTEEDDHTSTPEEGLETTTPVFGSPIPAVTANDYSWYGFPCLAFAQ